MAERAEDRISAEEHDTRMNEVDAANAPDPGESSDYVDKTALPRNDPPTGLADEEKAPTSAEHSPMGRDDS